MAARGIGKGSDRKSVTDELSRGRPVLALLIAFPYRTSESGIFFFGLSNLPRSVGRSVGRSVDRSIGNEAITRSLVVQ